MNAAAPIQSVRRRLLLGTALILGGSLLAFGGRLLIITIAASTDTLVARSQARQTADWIRRHQTLPAPPFSAPTRASAPAGVPVITPGQDGYLLIIPKIGLRAVVRELEPDVLTGTNTRAFRRYGLGQVPYTTDLRNVSPGAEGTAVIAGHRTTSGAPFKNIDRLSAGDLIVTRKDRLELRWIVTGSTVVPPDAVEVIRSDIGTRRLVLLSCSPPFSAEERIVVYARPSMRGLRVPRIAALRSSMYEGQRVTRHVAPQ